MSHTVVWCMFLLCRLPRVPSRMLSFLLEMLSKSLHQALAAHSRMALCLEICLVISGSDPSQGLPVITKL